MTRLCAPLLALLAALAPAQETIRESISYEYDLNGNRVSASGVGQVSSDGRTSRTERMQTVNGRSAPVESVEESVTVEGGIKVTERVIRRFDQTGNPLPTEKIRTEQRQTAAGLTATSTVYRSDLNGRFELAERSSTESTKTGDVLKSTTVVERPVGSGSFETVERRDALETTRAEGSAKDVVTWRKDASGGFYAAARETADIVQRGDRVTSTVTQYNAANSGTLEFAGQTVAETEKQADGSETRVVNIYGATPTGRAVSQAAGQAFLKEQQIIERRPRPDGSTVEVFGIRRPSVADDRLGEYQRISEMVCKGECGNDAAQSGQR